MGYEPKKPEKNKLKILCPFKLANPDLTNNPDRECETCKCALWLPIQRACSLQVIARGNAFLEGEY